MVPPVGRVAVDEVVPRATLVATVVLRCKRYFPGSVPACRRLWAKSRDLSCKLQQFDEFPSSHQQQGRCFGATVSQTTTVAKRIFVLMRQVLSFIAFLGCMLVACFCSRVSGICYFSSQSIFVPLTVGLDIAVGMAFLFSVLVFQPFAILLEGSA